MRLQVNNAVVVGPTNGFGESWVLPDDGAECERPHDPRRHRRPGRRLQPRAHPDRRHASPRVPQSSTSATATPRRSSASSTTTSATSSSCRRRRRPASADAPDPRGDPRRSQPGRDLDRRRSTSRTSTRATPSRSSRSSRRLIVNNLRSPDLLLARGDPGQQRARRTTAPSMRPQTLSELIAAIQSEGGPAYEFRQINPVNNAGRRRARRQHPRRLPVPHRPRPGVRRPPGRRPDDGDDRRRRRGRPGAVGQPRPDRADERRVQREPQAAGRRVHVQRPPLLRRRPTTSTRRAATSRCSAASSRRPLTSEAQRLQQAPIVNDFVDEILAVDPNAEIVVLGDLNDFEFSAPVQTLVGSPPGR